MLGVINRMAKKFNYKLPSMVALTLVGSAVTAHQVQAAETTQDQTTNKNVLDSNKVKATTGEQAKAEVEEQNAKHFWHSSISRPCYCPTKNSK